MRTVIGIIGTFGHRVLNTANIFFHYPYNYPAFQFLVIRLMLITVLWIYDVQEAFYNLICNTCCFTYCSTRHAKQVMWGYDTHPCHAVRWHWSTNENIHCHTLYHSIICVNIVYDNTGTEYSLRETPEAEKNDSKLNTVNTNTTHKQQHTTHDNCLQPHSTGTPNQLICRTGPPSSPRPLPATPTFRELHSRSVALSPLD